MIFGKTRLELKVGIFVFIGAVILIVAILSIGGFKTWTSGYRVKFIFNFVNGVKIGAPVRFAGVDAGEVKRINLFFDPQEAKAKVRIACWIRRDVNVPMDSTIWVNTLGLLGEKYIEIIPGKDYSRCLAGNEQLSGIDPMPMHEITELAKGIARNIDQTMSGINSREGTIGKLIYDPKIYNEMDMFITNVRKNPWKLFFRAKEVK